MKLIIVFVWIIFSPYLLADQASDLMDELKLITESSANSDAQLPQKVKELFNSSHLKDQEEDEDYVNLSLSAPQRKTEANNINHLNDPLEKAELDDMMKELQQDEQKGATSSTQKRSRTGWRSR